jgi:hypothetical protein
MGRQLVVIDRDDIQGGVAQIWEGYQAAYSGRPSGMVYTIYAPMTRTASGKNEMTDRIAPMRVKLPGTRVLRDIEDSRCGPDDPHTLWRPHTVPFEYALELARQKPQQVEVVYSVIRYRIDGTLEIEFFQPPKPLEHYVRQIGHRFERLDPDSGKRFPGEFSLKDIAQEFQDDTIDWIRTRLLPEDDYFRRYVNAYYRIDQVGVLGKGVGGRAG